MITLSEGARTHLEQALIAQTRQDASVAAIKLGVRRAGCSGYEYVIDFTKEINAENISIALGLGQLLISKSDLENYLEGMHIDYVQDGLNVGLKFENPNAENYCGCGESFNLKDRVE
jgi:iron-sulfur cluster assembly protein